MRKGRLIETLEDCYFGAAKLHENANGSIKQTQHKYIENKSVRLGHKKREKALSHSAMGQSKCCKLAYLTHS